MIRNLFLLLLMMMTLAASAQKRWRDQVINDMRPAILERAAWAAAQAPETITAFRCNRSAGGIHDFYSEGDYWWPNPVSVDSPYIQKDGQSNPDNFVAHRQAMIRFSRIMGALAAGYMASQDKTYLEHALLHAKAWFADPATRMNPSLQFAQAIKGRATGRGIGIIDTIQLMEVVQALKIMEKAGIIPAADLEAIRSWFEEYLQWLTTHPYGKDEMKAANNHGTCWVMQVAVFASFTHNDSLLTFCTDRYKNVLLPAQMAADGSFPLELKRTKPYGYSLFNLDAMSTLCQVLSKPGDNLWAYTLEKTKSIAKGISWMYPFVKDKNNWPFAHDIMYWENWPVAHPFLIFGAVAYNKKEYYQTWLRLDHDPQVEEVLRNLPVRNPLIWL